MSPLEIWHTRVDLARAVRQIDDRSLKRQLSTILAKTAGRLEQDDNFPHLVKGKRARIADRPPLIYHFSEQSDARHRLATERVFAAYNDCLAPEVQHLLGRYRLCDVAFKVVGV